MTGTSVGVVAEVAVVVLEVEVEVVEVGVFEVVVLGLEQVAESLQLLSPPLSFSLKNLSNLKGQ